MNLNNLKDTEHKTQAPGLVYCRRSNEKPLQGRKIQKQYTAKKKDSFAWEPGQMYCELGTTSSRMKPWTLVNFYCVFVGKPV